MKILIDGQTLLTPEINRGIGIYFKNCLENILENDFTNDFYINTANREHLKVLSPSPLQKLCAIDNEAYDIPVTHQNRREYVSERYSNTLHNDIDTPPLHLNC